MIITELYNGQGIGNQLWCYVTTRVIALDKGYDFGIKSPEKFLGKELFDLDFGKVVKGGSGPEGGPPVVLPEGITSYYREKELYHPYNGADIRGYDHKLTNIADNTKIDGCLQGERYIAHRKNEIREWLKTNPELDCTEYANDDTCVINFRGGGYAFTVDFFLHKKYWRDAISAMRARNPKFKFIVVTDDVRTAKKFFPNFEVYHWNIAKDYIVIKNAHYLILSNSSCAWFPAWLSTNLKYCIAPKYWGRHNISDGYWSMSTNLTQGWMYMDRRGRLHSYEECEAEHTRYMRQHPEIYGPRDNRPISLSNKIKNIVSIYRTLAGDLSPIFAIGWIVRTRGLRGAIWIKDRITYAKWWLNRMIFVTSKNAKRVVKKVLRQRQVLIDKLIEKKTKKTWKTPAEIAEYRKKIKVYDMFVFFNELDLLDIRLNILDSKVDYFVIVEATKTFTGIEKPLHYDLNKDRFKKFHHKIIHVIVDDMPDSFEELEKRKAGASPLDRAIIDNCLTTPRIAKGVVHWLREYYQKEQMHKGLTKARDEDYCFISDLDEIWNPEILIDYSSDDIYKLRQVPYGYYLNNRSDEDDSFWAGTFGTKYRNLRGHSINHTRTRRMTKSIVLSNGGWHFTFTGGPEDIIKKLEAYGHQEFNNDRIKSNVGNILSGNGDLRGRNVKYTIDERGLPKYILANRAKYQRLFR